MRRKEEKSPAAVPVAQRGEAFADREYLYSVSCSQQGEEHHRGGQHCHGQKDACAPCMVSRSSNCGNSAIRRRPPLRELNSGVRVNGAPECAPMTRRSKRHRGAVSAQRINAFGPLVDSRPVVAAIFGCRNVSGQTADADFAYLPECSLSATRLGRMPIQRKEPRCTGDRR